MSTHLNAEQLKELRNLLSAERDRLRGRMGMPDANGVVEVGDAQDRASEEEQFENSIRVGDHERTHLLEIEAALVRMDSGSYGVCEETGDPIPFARLKLEPTTRYTVDALEVLEQERNRDRIAGREPDENDEQPY
ncbi:MAG: TraR/DksA family transcriptional regulator [Deltaproteobacteria bacterium]|nr:TraR/DksA family transcriptional regulator [Nannocystaceae bacterium]